MLADRAPVPTPATLDWAVQSVHTVGANSPQKDKFGKMWAFQSWSDGGDVNHAYTVASYEYAGQLDGELCTRGRRSAS